MSLLDQDTSRHTRAACAGCGARDTLTIAMTAGKGGPQVTMTSCPRCEHRQWTDETGVVAGRDLLQVLSGRPDFVFTPLFKGERRRN